MSWPQDLVTGGKQEAIQEFREAKSAAGTEIDYTLEYEPVSRYGHLDTQALTARFDSLLAGSHFTPSTNLTLAAHELNRFYQEHRQLAPSDVLSFILDSSGATYGGVQQVALVTTNMSDTLLRKLIRDQRSSKNRGWDIGLSDLRVPGQDGLRVIIVLLAERTVQLKSFPRRLAAGIPHVLRGTLAQGYTQPHALAMSPRASSKTSMCSPQGNPLASSGPGHRVRGSWKSWQTDRQVRFH